MDFLSEALVEHYTKKTGANLIIFPGGEKAVTWGDMKIDHVWRSASADKLVKVVERTEDGKILWVEYVEEGHI